jgi:hypothetical protein
LKTLQPWGPEGRWWLFVEVVELVRKAGRHLGPAAFEGRPGKPHQVSGFTLAVLTQQLTDALAFRVESFELGVKGIQQGTVHSDGLRCGIVVGDGVLKREVLGIEIAPDIVDPDDVETLADIITAAINEGIKRVDDTNSTEMAKITGGMGGFPGMF